MLIIQRNGSSPLIVTVTELTTIASPKYLFEFIHEQSFKSYVCILTNVSIATLRYDEFLLIDGVDLNFDYNGSYVYNIYQQTSSVNLNPTLSQGIVETGRAEVVEAAIANNFYESPITFEIYE